MSVAETQYFALLRAALWDTPATVDGTIDWQGFMQLAQHHANNVLISGVALQLPNEQRPPVEMQQKMQTALRSNLVKQMHLRQILVSANQLLRQHDIAPVLLKGFGLASLYPNPNLRQFGDIDLFVGLEHFHEACALLRTLPGGYNWGGEVDAGHHYNIEFGPYPMEVHRVSADVPDPEEALEYATIERDGLMEHPRLLNLDGAEVGIPSKEFMVFFTFYHAWHHFLTSGVGWRQISDVAMTLHAYHGQLDTEKLHRWLNDLHLMQPWQTFGVLMVKYLGLPETEMPFFDKQCDRKANKLYKRIMEEGNFKRENKFKRHKPKAGFKRKLHAAVGIFVDFFHIVKVFPDTAFRQLRSALKVSWKKNIQKK